MADSSQPAPPAGFGQNGTGMPPPPAPNLNINIPQNNSSVPAAIEGILSPTSGGGSIRRAAPEPNKRALYVGGLDPRVTEDVLKQIFETTGHVQNVKIIPDKNVSAPTCEGQAHMRLPAVRNSNGSCDSMVTCLCRASFMCLACSLHLRNTQTSAHPLTDAVPV